MTNKKHIIDCDTTPLHWGYGGGGGARIKEHIKGGQFSWNPDEIELYLCKEQEESPVKGHELREKLKNKPLLNACVMHYLLQNQQLIPEEWKGKNVCFWGTIYASHPGGYPCICFLYWPEGACKICGEWTWSDMWLNIAYGNNYHAALSCKP